MQCDFIYSVLLLLLSHSQFLFAKLRSSRYQGRDENPKCVGTLILPCPQPITYIIIKKKDIYKGY
jgi:hypothetical protein